MRSCSKSYSSSSWKQRLPLIHRVESPGQLQWKLWGITECRHHFLDQIQCHDDGDHDNYHMLNFDICQAQSPLPVSCDLFMLCLVTQSCPNLCDPMDCSPPGFSVHGDYPGKNTGVASHALLQRSSQPRNQTTDSCIAGGFFTIWATKEVHLLVKQALFPSTLLMKKPHLREPGKDDWDCSFWG